MRGGAESQTVIVDPEAAPRATDHGHDGDFPCQWRRIEVQICKFGAQVTRPYRLFT